MSWRKKIRICSLQGETNEPHFSLWKKIPWHFFKLLELFARVYGVEHLLRLFTKLPVILGQVSMASVEASQLQTNLSDFLKYLQKNAGSMFSGSHAIPAADSFEIRRWCEDWKSSIDFLSHNPRVLLKFLLYLHDVDVGSTKYGAEWLDMTMNFDVCVQTIASLFFLLFAHNLKWKKQQKPK